MASRTLFRNAHNVPLKCFIQYDTDSDTVSEVKSLLETHGADVSTYLQHALVILVDPPTDGGKLLIREFGNDANRAILDFGWVKECVAKGRCIGPSENWGGHRLPVTNVNDFFSYDAPPPSNPPYYPVHSIGPYQHGPPPHNPYAPQPLAMQQGPVPVSMPAHLSPSVSLPPVPTPSASNSVPAPPAGPPLPVPAISQPLPPSPILTHRERSEGKPEVKAEETPHSGSDGINGNGVAASESASTPAPAAALPDVTSTKAQSPSPSPVISEPEPTPPDPSSKVLHHNGMGAKFTEVDTHYIRDYFRWSTKYFPGRTQKQVLDKVHEKMPYHSAISITQFMRRHPEIFSEWKKTEEPRPAPPPKEPKPPAPKVQPVEDNYDPGPIDSDNPPKPPTNLIPFAKGYRFTPADDMFITAYFNWYHSKSPNAGKNEILRALAVWAPYRSLPSWTTYMHKHAAKWRTNLPWLLDDLDDDGSADSHSHIEQKPVVKQEPTEPEEGDTRRWNPPRRTASLRKLVNVSELATEEYDEEFDGQTTARTHSPRTPRAAAPLSSVSDGSRRSSRQTADGGRRRLAVFTAEEKKDFIEFLSEHPWVWTTVTAPADWLTGATTASAVWQKYENLHPHRSDASWREFHKRNAAEFDAEAKRLRQNRYKVARKVSPPRLPPTEEDDDIDHDPVDEPYDEDDGDYALPEDEQASSFPYHPRPPPESDEEDDQLNSDEDDMDGIDGAALGAGPVRRRGGGSRRGRAYLPFTDDQRDKFMDFLSDNPQVWIGATPESHWITWEQSHLGKDMTWRKLADMPGMENHSYKSWREFHRARASDVDKQAKKRRLAKEAQKASAATSSQASTLSTPQIIPASIPTKMEITMEIAAPLPAPAYVPPPLEVPRPPSLHPSLPSSVSGSRLPSPRISTPQLPQLPAPRAPSPPRFIAQPGPVPTPRLPTPPILTSRSSNSQILLPSLPILAPLPQVISLGVPTSGTSDDAGRKRSRSVESDMSISTTPVPAPKKAKVEDEANIPELQLD